MSRRNLTVLHANDVWLLRTQNWIYNQVRFLPDEVESHIFCRKVTNLGEFQVPNIHCTGIIAGNRGQDDAGHIGDRAGDPLRELAKRIKPQILHSHFGSLAWKNIGAASDTGMQHVVSFYGYDATSWPDRRAENPARYHELFDTVAGVFCEGPALAERVVGLGCPREKVIVHHLGADLDLIEYKPRIWLPGTALRVLLAATFREKKGIPFGIRALGAIRDGVDLEITIIGDSRGDWDIKEKAKILATIDECGLAENVRMMGFQPHPVFLAEAYRHHIFLAPSITAADGDAEGGAPVSIIEAAASGMPVVSSRHCDIPDVIIDGKTGWLAPERDWQTLAERFRWLITHVDDWRHYLDAGRRRIEAEYNCRKQGISLAEHYRRLAGMV